MNELSGFFVKGTSEVVDTKVFLEHRDDVGEAFNEWLKYLAVEPVSPVTFEFFFHRIKPLLDARNVALEVINKFQKLTNSSHAIKGDSGLAEDILEKLIRHNEPGLSEFIDKYTELIKTGDFGSVRSAILDEFK